MGSISRTSSTCSIDYTFNPGEQRRTRKRITASQLTQLEQLYQESSHPTREQRDTLARRIQMETKSVTIWFQNKRQTDRKVALHNATSSRNSISVNNSTSSPTPSITITTPTSPAAAPQESNGRRVPDELAGRQPSISGPKRTLSCASSVSSSSTTSSSRTHPSLDRVASRSEIRFTVKSEKPKLSPTISATPTPLLRSTSHSSLVHRTLPAVNDGVLSTSNSAPVSPPPSSSSRDLWAHMLSSPVAPSSPPAPDIVAYARTRKTRTLDWACAVSSVSSGEDLPSLSKSAPHPHASNLNLHDSGVDAVACQHEYEAGTVTTEDEAEVVTPQSSQDTSMNWNASLGQAGNSRASDSLKSLHFAGLVHPMDGERLQNSVPMDTDGWQEDEMKAALALCGLKG